MKKKRKDKSVNNLSEVDKIEGGDKESPLQVRDEQPCEEGNVLSEMVVSSNVVVPLDGINVQPMIGVSSPTHGDEFDSPLMISDGLANKVIDSLEKKKNKGSGGKGKKSKKNASPRGGKWK